MDELKPCLSLREILARSVAVGVLKTDGTDPEWDKIPDNSPTRASKDEYRICADEILLNLKSFGYALVKLDDPARVERVGNAIDKLFIAYTGKELGVLAPIVAEAAIKAFVEGE